MANKKWLKDARKKMERKGTVGAFTQYCGGRVTEECIQRGLNSNNPLTKKRAQFAKNVRNMQAGGYQDPNMMMMQQAQPIDPNAAQPELQTGAPTTGPAVEAQAADAQTGQQGISTDQKVDAASQAQGNAEWKSAIAVMYVIYMAGGVAIAIYFAQQLTAKKLWGKFKTPHLGKNIMLTSVMGVFNFAASSIFAYAAFKLGETGGSVGYAIFNTACVVTAIVSGLITKEWVKASSKAKGSLYFGLTCMVIGILIVAYSNSL